MSENIEYRQEEVNREIDETYQSLVKRKDEQKALDRELKELMAKRHHYSLISEISDRLEQLQKEGGAELFWGEDFDHTRAGEITRRARDKVINFDSRVAELQKRYDELENEVNKLKSQQGESQELESKINELEQDMQYQKQPVQPHK